MSSAANNTQTTPVSDRFRNHPTSLLLAAGVLLATGVALYLAVAQAATGSGGVPLDDAWIHQTLARNLAETGQMVIVPGEPSAAATSPLWSALLAIPYLFGWAPLLWTFALGIICLAASAYFTYRLGRALFPGTWVASAAVLLTLADWRLVWAALSGMETLLFTALTLAALSEAAVPREKQRGWLLGLLCGCAAAARPEGLALGALILLWLCLRHAGRVRALAGFLPGFALPLIPIVRLNLLQFGSPLPATFFAKNAAYGAGFDAARLMTFGGDALGVLARGPELLLSPGLVWFVAQWLRRRTAATAPLMLWCGGLLLAYALWLPALYHHGRYVFPLLPPALLLGLQGSRLLLQHRPLPRLWLAAGALLALYSGLGWLRGAQVYADNIALINQQQVWAARWVLENTAPGAVIAAHDIGALTYFSRRPIVDMAGLATPELLFGPRDTAAVVRLVRTRAAPVALVIPDWYPPLYTAIVRDLDGKELAGAPAPATTPNGQRMRVMGLSR